MCRIRAPPECWRVHKQKERLHHSNSERAAHPARCAAFFSFLPDGRERINFMIPDDTFIFNCPGVFKNFDDHEVRLRHLLKQDAIPSPRGGRHLLYVCPVCKHPWYKAGKHEYPRLTHEQLTFLSAILHADIRALHLLPRTLCPICSIIHLGGMFSVGAYAHNRGYHLLWESASPSRIQLLAMVCRGEGLTLDTLLHLSPDTLPEPLHSLCSVLAWLETCPFPKTILANSEQQCLGLARRFPPGNAADGKAHHWYGYAWSASCPPLGGDVLVSLAIAVPPLAPSPFGSLLIGWHVLARAMRTVL